MGRHTTLAPVKEKAEKIIQADSLIFQTEKQLKEYESKLSEGNRTAMQPPQRSTPPAGGGSGVSTVWLRAEKASRKQALLATRFRMWSMKK